MPGIGDKGGVRKTMKLMEELSADSGLERLF
jgi:hypothetical protein